MEQAEACSEVEAPGIDLDWTEAWRGPGKAMNEGDYWPADPSDASIPRAMIGAGLVDTILLRCVDSHDGSFCW
jgi:hypothetical protein